MEVRNLFYNLPARRKFLRSEETEKAHIQHYLTLAAVAHPQVAFTFVQDGRIVWQLPGIKNAEGENALEALKERLRALLSAGIQLVPVNHAGSIQNYQTEDEAVPSHDTMRIWGLIGAPGVSRGNRDEQYVFVNRRPVENRGINFALLEGYHTSLMKGRYPVCALFIEINPASVDVNIHPSKREIKFRQEQAVRKIVADAVREALLAYHTAQQPAPPRPPPRIDPLEEPTSTLKPESPAQPVRSLPSEPIPWPERESAAAPTLRLRAENPGPPPVEQSNFGWAPASSPAAPSVPLLEVPLRLVGVIGKLYVVLESDRGLVLLDQHAAHERILFEQMLRRVEQSGVAPSQGLLLPETIELSIRDAHFLREQMPILVKLGVSLSEFGERTFLLDGLPPFVRKTAPRTFVLELIEALKQAGNDVNSWRLGEHTVAKTVCRHAVKANDALSGLELENLVEDLRRCQMPYTCPHGRPTLIEMNFRELEKKFGRSQ
jgi:DNA mismatch repair protein MutL